MCKKLYEIITLETFFFTPGAHLNPAISFAFFLTGRLTLFRFFVYSIAQFIGSFLGAVVCYLVYYDSLKVFKAGMYSLDTAGIFATYPNANLSVFGGFLDQTVGTIILVLVVLALNDKRNSFQMPRTNANVFLVEIFMWASLHHHLTVYNISVNIGTPKSLCTLSLLCIMASPGASKCTQMATDQTLMAIT